VFVDPDEIRIVHQLTGCARRGKTSVDWFYGFKLHLVINDCGELLSVRLTPGNTDDRRPVPELVKGLFGKLFGDRGLRLATALRGVV
jgi:Transposase DDE domain